MASTSDAGFIACCRRPLIRYNDDIEKDNDGDHRLSTQFLELPFRIRCLVGLCEHQLDEDGDQHNQGFYFYSS